MAGFGKHAPKGAGFAQSLQATYLTPINNKLSLMVGGYISNLNWGDLNARYAGIYGELSYQFNEHWEAHVYGQKNIAGNTGYIPGLYSGGYWGSGLPPYWGGAGAVDRIGAADFKASFGDNYPLDTAWNRRVYSGFSKQGPVPAK